MFVPYARYIVLHSMLSHNQKLEWFMTKMDGLYAELSKTRARIQELYAEVTELREALEITRQDLARLSAAHA